MVELSKLSTMETLPRTTGFPEENSKTPSHQLHPSSLPHQAFELVVDRSSHRGGLMTLA